MIVRPNVFVLCTGRCGSTTFIKAAEHISNYTAGHETRPHVLGNSRFAYPVGHIEADNRLSWLLGRLDTHYGDSAYYVHLERDLLSTARSFLSRQDRGILRAYRTEILMGASKELCSNPDFLPVCIDYCQTVTANIEAFLSNKSRRFSFRLESAQADWPRFCEWIEAEVDIQASMLEWSVKHNAGCPSVEDSISSSI